MSKNLLYIVAIDNPSTKVKNYDYAQYSIRSWEYYCKKYGIELQVCHSSLLDDSFQPIWNKELIYLEDSFEKFAIVDSDTMVRWDAPNIFDELQEGDFCGINDICDLNWLFSSIEQRQKFFPEVTIDISKYINAGVLFFTREYLYIFKELLSLYRANKSEIDTIPGGGKEQTLLNFVLQKNNVPIRLLDPSWNLLSIHRKNMFTNNWQLYPEFKDGVRYNEPNSWPHFIKYANIWHFTGFPIEDRVRTMSVVWDLFKGRYL
jgi:hypothetical protein